MSNAELTGHSGQVRIMSDSYEFWTHGVATILESPELARTVLHRGFGTLVEQDPNTEAWFHIPITSPTIFTEHGRVMLKSVGLKARTNENARLDIVHVRIGQNLAFARDVSFTERDIAETFALPRMLDVSGAGVTLCVHVQFLTGTRPDGSPLRGRVEFYGAGGNFLVATW